MVGGSRTLEKNSFWGYERKGFRTHHKIVFGGTGGPGSLKDSFFGVPGEGGGPDPFFFSFLGMVGPKSTKKIFLGGAGVGSGPGPQKTVLWGSGGSQTPPFFWGGTNGGCPGLHWRLFFFG